MGNKNRRKKKSVGAVICRLIGSLLILLVIAVCVPLTVPRLFGYQIYEVISGSMEPAIPTGSLVYVEEAEPEDVEEGEVIAFYSGTDGSIITHRVVTNQTINGQFITKGDANDAEDVTPVEYARFIGVLRYMIPRLGHFLSFLSESKGKMLAAGLLAVAVLFHVIALAFEREKEEA